MILLVELFALSVIAASIWYLKQLIERKEDGCERLELLKIKVEKDLEEAKRINEDTMKMIEGGGNDRD